MHAFQGKSHVFLACCKLIVSVKSLDISECNLLATCFLSGYKGYMHLLRDFFSSNFDLFAFNDRILLFIMLSS